MRRLALLSPLIFLIAGSCGENDPSERIPVHVQCWQGGVKIYDANLMNNPRWSPYWLTDANGDTVVPPGECLVVRT